MSELKEGWAIVELMGHRKRIGRVREVELAGTKMLRIDVPTPDGDVTEFYGGASIYGVHPCSEQVARDHVTDPRPVRPMDYREPTEKEKERRARQLEYDSEEL